MRIFLQAASGEIFGKVMQKQKDHAYVAWFADDPKNCAWLVGRAERGCDHSVQCQEYGAVGLYGQFRPSKSDDPNANWSKISIEHVYNMYSVDARGAYLKAMLDNLEKIHLPGGKTKSGINRKLPRNEATLILLGVLVDYVDHPFKSQGDLIDLYQREGVSWNDFFEWAMGGRIPQSAADKGTDGIKEYLEALQAAAHANASDTSSFLWANREVIALEIVMRLYGPTLLTHMCLHEAYAKRAGVKPMYTPIGGSNRPGIGAGGPGWLDPNNPKTSVLAAE